MGRTSGLTSFPSGMWWPFEAQADSCWCQYSPLHEYLPSERERASQNRPSLPARVDLWSRSSSTWCLKSPRWVRRFRGCGSRTRSADVKQVFCFGIRIWIVWGLPQRFDTRRRRDFQLRINPSVSILSGALGRRCCQNRSWSCGFSWVLKVPQYCSDSIGQTPSRYRFKGRMQKHWNVLCCPTP